MNKRQEEFIHLSDLSMLRHTTFDAERVEKSLFRKLTPAFRPFCVSEVMVGRDVNIGTSAPLAFEAGDGKLVPVAVVHLASPSPTAGRGVTHAAMHPLVTYPSSGRRTAGDRHPSADACYTACSNGTCRLRTIDRGRESPSRGSPSLRTGRADLPHPALQLVVLFTMEGNVGLVARESSRHV